MKNASARTEVRNAKDAIEAYKNITDAINAAEDAANEAKVAADDALNVSVCDLNEMLWVHDKKKILRNFKDNISLVAFFCFFSLESQKPETYRESKRPEKHRWGPTG